MSSNDMLGLVLCLIAGGLYMLPTLVGYGREVKHNGAIAVINIFLGWTLLGWVVALAMACASNSKRNNQLPQQYVVLDAATWKHLTALQQNTGSNPYANIDEK